MRRMLLVGLLLVAGCKVDWAGPDLSCLSQDHEEGCPTQSAESVTTVSNGEAPPASTAQIVRLPSSTPDESL